MGFLKSRWQGGAMHRMAVLVIGLVVGATVAAPAALARNYAKHPAAQQLVESMAAEHQIDKKWLQKAMQNATFNRKAQRLMRPVNRKGKKKRYGNWERYRAKFLIPERIRAGVDFWMLHGKALAQAEQRFGVPAHVVAGIIGVETSYGQNMGNFSVLDVLATLAFDFPATPERDRSDYFRGELQQFLLQHYLAGRNPQLSYGSYAGAVGYGQFMPSSIANYAVDFDGNGRIDLDNPVDAIGSVANYLRGHGWIAGVPAHYPAYFDGSLHAGSANMTTLLAPDIVPTFDVAQLRALGMRPDAQASQYTGQFALVEVFNGDPAKVGNTPYYVLGTQNFYVVTRYNRSSYYALAVLELGKAVQQAYAKAQ